MDYLRAFLEGAGRPSKNQNTYPGGATKPTKPLVNELKPGTVSFVGSSTGIKPDFEGYSGPSKDAEYINAITHQCEDPSKSGNTYLQEPTKPTKPSSVNSCPGINQNFEGHDGPADEPNLKDPARSPAHSIALVHAVVADWPIAWRERWGRLANELTEAGAPFPTDEHRAFTMVAEERQRGVEPPPIYMPPPADVRWRCGNRFCLHREAGWWKSQWGVVNCRNCVPPAFPSLVVAEGTLADAPLLSSPESSRTALRAATLPLGGHEG
jgi:hypothetical protein